MINTRRVLSRRTVLRGMGASLALPLLDGMVPAFAAPRPVRRFGAVYVPNGMSLPHFFPATSGPGFALSPSLKPLEPFRDRLVVFSGLSNLEANAQGSEGVGDHSRGAGSFLSGVHIRKTEGSDIRSGTTVDQIAAQALGRDTQLGSLQLAMESNEISGACDSGYSCAYMNTISWSSPTTPLPMERDPRAVFELMFGGSDSTDRHARLARIKQDRSVLDVVNADARRLNSTLGPGDRRRLDEYLEAVRGVEHRIQRAEEQSDRELPLVEKPRGVPPAFAAHAKLLYELQALAFQADLTRVFSFLFTRETTVRAYPEIGVSDAHHQISHLINDPEAVASVARVNAFHVSLFAAFLERLRATPDGDGNLLDNVLIVYGAGIGNANLHSHDNLPIALAGGGGGRVKGDQHLVLPQDTPLANLYVTLLDKLDVPIERLGDSTGRIPGLKLETLSGV